MAGGGGRSGQYTAVSGHECAPGPKAGSALPPPLSHLWGRRAPENRRHNTRWLPAAKGGRFADRFRSGKLCAANLRSDATHSERDRSLFAFISCHIVAEL